MPTTKMPTLHNRFCNLTGPGYMKYWTRPDWDASKVPDLTGKVALVTGGSSGLGFQTALHLAKNGAHVIATARSREKADEMLSKLKSKSEKGNFELLVLNLEDLKETKAASDNFLATGKKLDILVNNAGIINPNFELTPRDQLESNLAVNHIAPFLFTTRIKSALNKGARVVIVSSWAQSAITEPVYSSKVNDPEVLTGMLDRYQNSKLANVLFAQQLQKNLGNDYYVNSLHPGTAPTNLNRRIEKQPVVGQVVKAMMGVWAAPVDICFLTQLYLATSPEVVEKNYHGQYFHCVAQHRPDFVNPLAKGLDGEKLEEELCTFTESVIEEKLAALD